MADRTSIRRGLHPNGQMTALGYLLGLFLLPVLLPMLPLLLAYVVADWVAEAAESDADAGHAAYRDA